MFKIHTQNQKVQLYLFLVNDQKKLDVAIVSAYNLEDALVNANQNNPDTTISFVKSLDYEQMSQAIADQYGEPQFIVEDPKVVESKEVKRKKEDVVNYLKVIKDKYGDCKVSTIINKIKGEVL